VSDRPRPAEHQDGASTSREVSFEELQLSQRNHGMHLEGLRYDVTPAGMHYLLIHFDVPEAEEALWVLSIGGLVRNPLEPSMSDIRSRGTVTMPVTMECAGNGRARLSPRPISQPWITEAIGTAEWTGTPLRSILEEAGSTMMPSSSCSAAPTTGSRAVSSRTTSAACRSRTRCVRR
jgi:DMSO/TMAO reductase YedYZ molybdopterin-dependent catalytic subunit